jgi:hypothetical protein
MIRSCQICFAAVATVCGAAVHAVELHGLLEGRLSAVDAPTSWTDGGLGKLRSSDSGLSLGQAMLRADADVLDTVGAAVVFNAADDRRGVVGINEAWLSWNPVPQGAWKSRLKAGAFFPVTSVEIDYDSVGWTPSRTISSSAINSWIGEELRTKGVEWTLSRNGRLADSPHNFSLTAALFNGNDPAGTLLGWRGWSISDRITSLSEPLTLPDLPVYRPTGIVFRQSRTIHLFRELDGRIGYYASASYGYRDRIEVAAMHYDNRANPLVVQDHQYGWDTRFNHVSLRAKPGGGWEVLAQAMSGNTIMGPNALNASFRSWFALASHRFGPAGNITVRCDHFRISEADRLPSDPNTEHGHALALAYSHDLGQSLSLVTEILNVQSERPARALIGSAPDQRERSLSTALRWRF